MANPKVARATAKRCMTQALLEADTFVAEGRAKDVAIDHLRELKEKFVTSCNTYIDSIPQDEITEEIENDLANYFSKQCTIYSKVVLEINKSVSAAKDVKPNVNVDAASAISREEIAAILTVKQGSLSYDGAAFKYYNFIIRHKQAVKFIKDPSTKLSILLDSLTGRAAMIVGGCSLLGDDGYGEALDLLEQQFGNKEKIFGLIEKDLLEGKQVKSADQLLTFACVLRSAVTSMKVMQKEKDDASDPFYGFSDEPRNSASVHNASRAESHTFEPRAPASRSSESCAAESRSYVSRTNEPRTCPKCPICGGAHKVSYCEQFLSYSVDARIDCVKNYNICYNCLAVGHFVHNCKSRFTCQVCHKNHHSLLHISRDHVHDNRVVANGENVTHVLSRRAPGCNSGILPLVCVDVNNVQVSTLLDSGSNVSFVTRQLVKRLGLHERPASLEIATIAGVEKRRTSTVSLRLVGDVTLDMHVTDFIRVPIARDLSCYSHLRGVPYHQSSSADILIGQDYGFVFRELDVVSGAPEEPVAVRTVLGWTVSGPVHSDASCVSNFVSAKCQSFAHSENDRNVLSFWEDNVRLREDGHYELPVPWKRVNIEGVREPCVKSNLIMVQKRYQSLVRKLSTNEVLKEKYTDEMEKIIRLYAEPVPSDEICDGREYYLPHHSVVHPTKGKTRVVID